MGNDKLNEYFHNIFLNIEKLYFKNKLPLFNGILTKDKYIKININGNKIILNECVFDKNISLLEKDCSCTDVYKKIEYNNYVIHYGEGSYGGDGFIAIIDENNKIKWIMFHENINPIEEVEIGNNKIIGINNNNIKYEFEINWKEL
jgi:hypothetical protein